MFTVPKSFNSVKAFMLFRYVRLNARNLPMLKPNNEGPVQALRELKHSSGEAVEKSLRSPRHAHKQGRHPHGYTSHCRAGFSDYRRHGRVFPAPECQGQRLPVHPRHG